MDDASDLGFDFTPDLPISISAVSGRYLLFDIKVASWLRREHRMCGVTIGTLPIAPSQNLFLGVPIEIMPEEAQLLLERGIAVIVDDARAHDLAIRKADRARRSDYLAQLERQAKQVKQAKEQEKAQSKKRALDKKSKNATNSTKTNQHAPVADLLNFEDDEAPAENQANDQTGGEAVSVAGDPHPRVQPHSSTANIYQVTPASSELLLPPPASSPTSMIRSLPACYPLYRHLHDKGFFMTPGLRFGCQYSVYPGDPLRFHAHFVAVGTEWDEELDLMDIVGGGRLGTGVKKGFLLGGANPLGEVKTFSVEWAAM
jgi:tRNA-splicing endonuclease subunit Sen34